MAERTEALYMDQTIGIESIYTVIDGKQINIPGMVEDLRKKSRKRELFCPCGCGRNLILVAGDEMKREQHFRVWCSSDEKWDKCDYVHEGHESISDKIAIKCWLEDKIHSPSIRSRVNLSEIGNSDRRFELTFLIDDHRFAIDYCHLRTNLSDEKQSAILDNANDLRVLHICRYDSRQSEQYPEWLMKIQGVQKYCLFIVSKDSDYASARLGAAFFAKTPRGFWKRIQISEGFLSEYGFDDDKSLLFNGIRVEYLFVEKCREYEDWFLNEVRRIEDENRLAEERRHAIMEKAKRHQEESETQKEEQVPQQNDAERNRILEQLKTPSNLPLKDSLGTSWFQCSVCGKTGTESLFWTYRGNRGICYDCQSNQSHEPVLKQVHPANTDPNSRQKKICPRCGSMLVQRTGKYGPFMGCSAYPNCNYTQPVRR